MLGEIKNNLAENYRGDDNVLQQIINDVTSQALFISNRKNVDILKPEIKRCVISIYLQRGSEDTTNKSESGISSTYVDAIEKMRSDIIKNGKRVIF